MNNSAISVSFPTGNDKDSKAARMFAAIGTLQNLRGRGVGCPAVSTTFSAQLKAILTGTDTQAVPPSSPSPSPLPPSSTPTGLARLSQSSSTPKPPIDGVDPALIPDFGHQSGLNPTGTGDCDGITNAAGKIIKIPCICPPDLKDFTKASFFFPVDPRFLTWLQTSL